MNGFYPTYARDRSRPPSICAMAGNKGGLHDVPVAVVVDIGRCTLLYLKWLKRLFGVCRQLCSYFFVLSTQRPLGKRRTDTCTVDGYIQYAQASMWNPPQHVRREFWTDTIRTHEQAYCPRQNKSQK